MTETHYIKCFSCGKELENEGVIFKCPYCEKRNIARCAKCRKVSVNYKCECGFEGP